MEKYLQGLAEKALSYGAYKASVVKTKDIRTDVRFRAMCESNVCGQYGKCWTCPPDAGKIEDLIEKLYTYEYALVYQTVTQIEDSFDVEGMMEAGKLHNALVKRIQMAFADEPFSKLLHLGAGGCRICERCAKRDEEPCRFPERALSSLETYGINVSELAQLSGMKYINGANTVTYFGTALFSFEDGV